MKRIANGRDTPEISGLPVWWFDLSHPIGSSFYMPMPERIQDPIVLLLYRDGTPLRFWHRMTDGG